MFINVKYSVRFQPKQQRHPLNKANIVSQNKLYDMNWEECECIDLVAPRTALLELKIPEKCGVTLHDGQFNQKVKK